MLHNIISDEIFNFNNVSIIIGVYIDEMNKYLLLDYK